jgi:hypothetical protein
VGRPFSGMRISPDGARMAASRADSGADPDIWE